VLPADSPFICEAVVIGFLQGHFLDDAFRWSTLWVDHIRDDSLARYWRGRVLEAGLQLEMAAADYESALETAHGPQDAHERLAEISMPTINESAGTGSEHFGEALARPA
jgi:hypothetical protein